MLDDAHGRAVAPEKAAADIRTEHFAYLLDLERSGVLFAAGPFVDEDGVRHGAGMLLIRAATRAEAEQIAYAEPYTPLPVCARWR